MKINVLNSIRLLFLSSTASITFSASSFAEITSSISYEPISNEKLSQSIKIRSANVNPSYKVDRRIITSIVDVEQNTEILDTSWKRFYSNGRYYLLEIENVKKSSRKLQISLFNLLNQLKVTPYDQSDGKQVVLGYANNVTDYVENIDKIVSYFNRRIAESE